MIGRSRARISAAAARIDSPEPRSRATILMFALGDSFKTESTASPALSIDIGELASKA